MNSRMRRELFLDFFHFNTSIFYDWSPFYWYFTIEFTSSGIRVVVISLIEGNYYLGNNGCRERFSGFLCPHE